MQLSYAKPDAQLYLKCALLGTNEWWQNTYLPIHTYPPPHTHTCRVLEKEVRICCLRTYLHLPQQIAAQGCPVSQDAAGDSVINTCCSDL